MRAPNVDPIELGAAGAEGGRSRRRTIRGCGSGRGSCGCGGTRDKDILRCGGQLPDEMGAEFEATITRLTGADETGRRVRRGCRSSSAPRTRCVSLCDPPAIETTSTRRRWRRWPVLQVAVPLHGPAEIAGIPIADSLVGAAAGERVDHAGARRRRRHGGRRSGAPRLRCRPSCGARCCCATRAVGSPAARRRTRARRPITSCPAPGAAATRSPTSPPCARHTTDCWCRTGCSPWSATRTSPTGSSSSPPPGRHRESGAGALTRGSIHDCSSAAPRAPTLVSTSCPSRNTRRVGMPCTPKRGCGRRVVVDVHLHELHPAAETGGDVLERGRDHATRSAPRSPQVDHHRERRALDHVGEVGVARVGEPRQVVGGTARSADGRSRPQGRGSSCRSRDR